MEEVWSGNRRQTWWLNSGCMKVDSFFIPNNTKAEKEGGWDEDVQRKSFKQPKTEHYYEKKVPLKLNCSINLRWICLALSFENHLINGIYFGFHWNYFGVIKLLKLCAFATVDWFGVILLRAFWCFLVESVQ